MSGLLLITFLGFMGSLIAHSLLLLEIDIPSSHISIALQVGLILSFLTRLFLTRQLRHGDNWFMDSSIKNICPPKLKVLVLVFMAYGIITAIVNMAQMRSMLSVSMTETDYVVSIRKIFIGVFGLLVACYAFEFMVTLSFRILVAQKNRSASQIERFFNER